MRHLHLVLASALLVAPGCRATIDAPAAAPLATAADAPPRLPDLAAELVAMAALDQEVRQELVTFVRDHPGEDPPLDLALRMLSADAKHAERVRAIVAEHGWPGPELVGAEASHAAWLLVQHADSAPEFQARVLGLVEPLLDTGGIERTDFALLTDRVLVARGEPQRYGTQYVLRTVDGAPAFSPATPIADPEGLDARRAAMALGSHAAYLLELRAAMGLPGDVRVAED